MDRKHIAIDSSADLDRGQYARAESITPEMTAPARNSNAGP
jgi:hypothetical protein